MSLRGQPSSTTEQRTRLHLARWSGSGCERDLFFVRIKRTIVHKASRTRYYISYPENHNLTSTQGHRPQRENMMARHYSQKTFLENRVGLHYSRFWALLGSPLPENQ